MTDGSDATEGLIALGANLPVGEDPPVRTVARAMDLLEAATQAPVARSRLWQTPAFPPGAGPDFVNAAARIQWDGSAAELLAALHEIEAAFGRTRSARWEARIMDLDLLALGQTIAPDRETQARWAALPGDVAAKVTPDDLILPHPRLAERGFVLVPLAEVAPHWRHPVTGLSVAEMLTALDRADLAGIVPIDAGADAPSPLSFTARGDI